MQTHLKKLSEATKTSSINAIELGYEIAKLLVERSRPFMDGEFVKVCMMIAVRKLSPNETKTFENFSSSRMTQRKICDLSDDIFSQLKDRANDFVFFHSHNR